MTSQTLFLELGKVITNPYHKIKLIMEEKRRVKEKRLRIKMAVLSGSIRRVK